MICRMSSTRRGRAPEPMNSTAHVRRDGVDIWVGTQAPTRTRLDRAPAAVPLLRQIARPLTPSLAVK